MTDPLTQPATVTVPPLLTRSPRSLPPDLGLATQFNDQVPSHLSVERQAATARDGYRAVHLVGDRLGAHDHAVCGGGHRRRLVWGDNKPTRASGAEHSDDQDQADAHLSLLPFPKGRRLLGRGSDPRPWVQSSLASPDYPQYRG